MSVLSTINATISTAFKVTEKVIVSGGNTAVKVLEGTEEYADAFRRTGVVTNRTAELYELEALGKARAKAEDLKLQVSFEEKPEEETSEDQQEKEQQETSTSEEQTDTSTSK